MIIFTTRWLPPSYNDLLFKKEDVRGIGENLKNYWGDNTVTEESQSIHRIEETNVFAYEPNNDSARVYKFLKALFDDIIGIWKINKENIKSLYFVCHDEDFSMNSEFEELKGNEIITIRKMIKIEKIKLFVFQHQMGNPAADMLGGSPFDKVETKNYEDYIITSLLGQNWNNRADNADIQDTLVEIDLHKRRTQIESLSNAFEFFEELKIKIMSGISITEDDLTKIDDTKIIFGNYQLLKSIKAHLSNEDYKKFDETLNELFLLNKTIIYYRKN